MALNKESCGDKPAATYRYEVVRDYEAESPDCWENTDLFLDAKHWKLPDITPRGSIKEEDYNTYAVFFPNAADLTLIAGFIEGDFSSRCGYVYVRKDVWDCPSESLKAAQFLIEEWNMYLSEDVWGFKIYKDTPCACCGNIDTEIVESLWGIYGEDYAEQEAKLSCTTYT